MEGNIERMEWRKGNKEVMERKRSIGKERACVVYGSGVCNVEWGAKPGRKGVIVMEFGLTDNN